MGPFFELLKLLDVAGWVAQRLWLSALLLAAFGGAARAGRADGHRHAADAPGRGPGLRAVARWR